MLSHDYEVIKVAGGGANTTTFVFFFPISYSYLFSFPFYFSPECITFIFPSVHHDHYLTLLMALEGKEVSYGNLRSCPSVLTT